ncbi:hypothetical protein AMAG_11072 [Allomyces macrogynus ATCC 38327]|uniref:Uncharacterized protein n=1 Tax=Allomyces macrogynus (strain ATCC 38327) TaxID=578462 RepID=A0A0L0SSH0_ALLM3|nr:hypothetical protein AMAG_11072 [Allomyces macrogynus ATCC 38327]|eukprot:KNE65446.1 hypothetical protein AMAG_11072 [Allomyces macrogynus ATCC 38327]
MALDSWVLEPQPHHGTPPRSRTTTAALHRGDDDMERPHHEHDDDSDPLHSADELDDDPASRTWERQKRLADAQQNILSDLGLSFTSDAPDDVPPTPVPLARMLQSMTLFAHDLGLWPLDTMRLRVTVWQQPSLMTIIRSGRIAEEGPGYPWAGYLESMLLPIAARGVQRAVDSLVPAALNPSTAQPPNPHSSRRAALARRVQQYLAAATTLVTDVAVKYIVFPIRHAALMRQISLTPWSFPGVLAYGRYLVAPWATSHMFSARVPDAHLFVAHSALDVVESSTQVAVRAWMRRYVTRRSGASEDGEVPLSYALMEGFIPRLASRLMVHGPRCALLRHQLGLTRLSPFRLYAGIEPFVLAEIFLDWYLIELVAQVQKRISRP